MSTITPADIQDRLLEIIDTFTVEYGQVLNGEKVTFACELPYVVHNGIKMMHMLLKAKVAEIERQGPPALTDSNQPPTEVTQ